MQLSGMKDQQHLKILLIGILVIAAATVGGYVALTANPHSIFPLAAATINISIAVLVYLRNPQSKLHRVFALWNFV